jgi:tetratricopeptide (TPR) repeat protein
MRTIILLLFAAAAAVASQAQAGQLNDRGLAATEKHDFETAKKSYLEAIALWEKEGPEYAAHVAIVKMNLAQVYGAEGRRLECAAMLEESLRGFRSTLGIRDLRSLSALNILGGMHMMLGNHARAEELFREALPIERELYPKDTQLARTLGGLASPILPRPIACWVVTIGRCLCSRKRARPTNGSSGATTRASRRC